MTMAVPRGYVHGGGVHHGRSMASSAAASPHPPSSPLRLRPQRHPPQLSARPLPRQRPMRLFCAAMSTQARPRSSSGLVQGGSPSLPVSPPRSHICRGDVLRSHHVASSAAADPTAHRFLSQRPRTQQQPPPTTVCAATSTCSVHEGDVLCGYPVVSFAETAPATAHPPPPARGLVRNGRPKVVPLMRRATPPHL